MDETHLQRLRDLITDIYCHDDIGFSFDTDIALTKGYTKAEVEEADNILLSNNNPSIKSLQIKEDIIFCALTKDYNPLVLYFEEVKLIFIINIENDFHSYIYKEDLDKDIQETQAFIEKYKSDRNNSRDLSSN